MSSDDELQRLKATAVEQFGADAVAAAEQRALLAFRPIDLAEEKVEDDEADAAAAKASLRLSTFREAFRAELKRLLRPQ